MQIYKCNLCGKILDPKKDKYYSISDINFHVPDSGLTRIHFSHSKHAEGESNHEEIESWTNYCDLDFCEDCFEKVNLKRFL